MAIHVRNKFSRYSFTCEMISMGFPMLSVNEESPISESVSGCVPHTITLLLHHVTSNSMRGHPPEETKLAWNTKVRNTITNVVLTQ